MRASVFSVGVLAAVFGLAPSLRAEDAPGADASRRGYGWGVGLGVGIVLPDGEGELYLAGNVRRRLGGGQPEGTETSGRPAWSWGAPADQSAGGVHAYVEGEVGYWKRSAAAGDDRDLLLGLNLIGTVPTRVIDLSLGIGLGVHFTDFQAGEPTEDGDTRFGGNLQFGVDLHASRTVAIFGVGRFDLLEGDRHRQQSKIWAGLRFKI